MNWKRYSLIASTLLVVDWILGAMAANGVVPDWLLLAVNFPCAAPYVWLESQWAGTHYEVSGQTVNESWAFVLFFFMIIAQAGVYEWVFRLLSTRRSMSASA